MSEQASGTASRLQLAACVLDLEARELRTSDDRQVQLRPKALDVLLVLAERAGQVVDKRALMEQVWPGVVVGDDSLTQTVVDIRRAIGDPQRRVVCTVARRGYRLQPSEASASAPAPALSIAVLPITHDEADPDSERLAAVLTAELTSKAGVGLSDSKVVARETVAAAGVALADPCHAARRLVVQQVVCGELRAVPHGWRLALAVVDGASGARRWSHRFVLARAGLPEQIRTVTAQAARAVFVEMHRMAAQTAAARPPSERSASDFALQGWASIYDGISPCNLERAQQFFEQAVARDPSHRRGLGGIGITNHWLLLTGWASDRRKHDGEFWTPLSAWRSSIPMTP
jgi:DNA-binding winged helix-turn-helix (wHTH) protein